MQPGCRRLILNVKIVKVRIAHFFSIQSSDHFRAVIWCEIKQQTEEGPLKQPLLIVNFWVNGQMRSADEEEEWKKDERGGLQKKQMTDEKDESRKMTEQNNYPRLFVMDWNHNNMSVLQQRLEGGNEYKWEDLRPKLEDCVCLVWVRSIPSTDTESLTRNLKGINTLKSPYGIILMVSITPQKVWEEKIESLKKKELISF